MSVRGILDHRGDVVSEVLIEDEQTTFATHHNPYRELKYVEQLREISPSGGEYKLVGSMPGFAVEQAVREGWYHDTNRMISWLNDSDNRAFQVHGD